MRQLNSRVVHGKEDIIVREGFHAPQNRPASNNNELDSRWHDAVSVDHRKIGISLASTIHSTQPAGPRSGRHCLSTHEALSNSDHHLTIRDTMAADGTSCFVYNERPLIHWFDSRLVWQSRLSPKITAANRMTCLFERMMSL
jgi:hypothetical protein